MPERHEDAGSIKAFHGSISEKVISRFWPGSHFGTREAAEHRIRDALALDPETRPFGMESTGRETPRIYEVVLKIENPCVISDGCLDLEDQVRDLTFRGIIPESLGERILREDLDLEAQLERLGFDAFQYENSCEDSGSVSWVPFRSEQIEIVGMEPWEPKASLALGF